MIKIIKSLIAVNRYQKALGSLSSSFPTLALNSIRKAVEIAPDEKIKPRYLSLQAEIEMGLGYQEKALETLIEAKRIIEKYSDYWNSGNNRNLAQRVKEALVDFQKIVKSA